MKKWFWNQVGKLAMSDRGFEWLQNKRPSYWGRVFRWRLNWWDRPQTRKNAMMWNVGKSRHIVLRGWVGVEYPGKHWPQQKNDVRFVKLEPGDHMVCEDGDQFKISQLPRGGCWVLSIHFGRKS